jgi:hypothetical protein
MYFVFFGAFDFVFGKNDMSTGRSFPGEEREKRDMVCVAFGPQRIKLKQFF